MSQWLALHVIQTVFKVNLGLRVYFFIDNIIMLTSAESLWLYTCRLYITKRDDIGNALIHMCKAIWPTIFESMIVQNIVPCALLCGLHHYESSMKLQKFEVQHRNSGT